MIFLIVVIAVCAIRFGFRMNSVRKDDGFGAVVDAVMGLWAIGVLFKNFYN
jgi:hypothetical protein